MYKVIDKMHGLQFVQVFQVSLHVFGMYYVGYHRVSMDVSSYTVGQKAMWQQLFSQTFIFK